MGKSEEKSLYYVMLSWWVVVSHIVGIAPVSIINSIVLYGKETPQRHRSVGSPSLCLNHSAKAALKKKI